MLVKSVFVKHVWDFRTTSYDAMFFFTSIYFPSMRVKWKKPLQAFAVGKIFQTHNFPKENLRREF